MAAEGSRPLFAVALDERLQGQSALAVASGRDALRTLGMLYIGIRKEYAVDATRESPHDRHSVAGKKDVLSRKPHAFGQRLRDQDPVERIFVEFGKSG